VVAFPRSIGYMIVVSVPVDKVTSRVKVSQSATEEEIYIKGFA